MKEIRLSHPLIWPSFFWSGLGMMNQQQQKNTSLVRMPTTFVVPSQCLTIWAIQAWISTFVCCKSSLIRIAWSYIRLTGWKPIFRQKKTPLKYTKRLLEKKCTVFLHETAILQAIRRNRSNKTKSAAILIVALTILGRRRWS